MWRHIRNDPFLSAMYRDEILARDLKEERRARKTGRVNRRAKATLKRLR